MAGGAGQGRALPSRLVEVAEKRLASLRGRELPQLRQAERNGRHHQVDAVRSRIQGALGISRQDLRDAIRRARELGPGEVAAVRVAADAVESQIEGLAAEAGVAATVTAGPMVGPGFGSLTGGLALDDRDAAKAGGGAPVEEASGWPRDPAGMRRYLINLIAQGGFAAAQARVLGLQLGAPLHLDLAATVRTAGLARDQLERLRSEANTFRKTFEHAAAGTAQGLLGESEREIAAALQSYGLDTSPRAFTLMSDLLIKNDALLPVKDPHLLDLAVETLMRTSRSGRHKQAFATKEARAHRESLAPAARELVELQRAIAALQARRSALVDQGIRDDHCHAGHHRDGGSPGIPTDARWRSLWKVVDRRSKRPEALAAAPASASAQSLPPGAHLARVNQDILAARAHYRARWLALEHAHPMLAAYRPESGDADPDALERLGSARDSDQAVRSLLTTVLPRVANIHKTRLALQGGRLSPLELPPVVELTCRRLQVAPGSLRERVVDDAVAEARAGGWKSWAISAVTLGLTIMAAVGTGGAAAPLAADLAALSFDAYSLGAGIQDFQVKSAAANTAADPALALTHEKPSATALAAQAAALTLGAGALARSIGRATGFALAEDELAGAAAGPAQAFHVTTSPRGAQGVLGGIDKEFLNKESRFGKAFYMAERPETAIAELKHHNAIATHGIRYSVNLRGVRLIDLTNPEEAASWLYGGGDISSTTRAIGELARDLDYSAIRFHSERGPGANLAILDQFERILKPLMVSPAK